MDAPQFDALAQGMARRGVLRAVLVATGVGAFTAATPTAHAGPSEVGFCTEKPKGGRCRRNGQCCSGDCKRKRKKKGKRKGKCRCSPLQARCSSGADCCPPAV